MWEIPFYLIVMPGVTVSVSLITAIKFKRYVIAPLAIFFILNIPTIILPMNSNIGWLAIFGWACVYTALSLVISLIVYMISKRSTLSKAV